ncbi:MAG: hypothetical protein NMNS01_27530 [Nitrosomonas sp.]|nr:MAG: hypothetical protein NMNS01_27530 [Nitrosomonas sp.]
MNHPTKKQMQTVIDNFKKIRKFADKNGFFEIYDPDVLKGTSSKTVACVAGWYMHAVKDYGAKWFNHGENGIFSFEHGGNLIANELGFKNKFMLEMWAGKHPRIWGNNNGVHMFSKEPAWNGIEDRADKMSCVIEHLEGVRDRLPG